MTAGKLNVQVAEARTTKQGDEVGTAHREGSADTRKLRAVIE
jgi:hypothetical protein